MKLRVRARLRALSPWRRRAFFLSVTLVVLWIGWRVFRLAAGNPHDALARAGWMESTRIVDRNGRLIGERPSSAGLRGQHVKLADVSPRLVQATIASEDRSFMTHDGVDRQAIVRALYTNLRHGKRVSGGSTITTQLVKRIDGEGKPMPRTLRRKIVEIARAQNLEGSLDKDQILEAYLNVVDYGHGWAGPEAAAQGYFGASAKDLSLAQAALLAVLPRAPSALDPHRHLERAVLRQRALLRSMNARGEVTNEDLERALAEAIVLRPRTAPKMIATHFVLATAKNEHGDVRTTLDLDLQHDVEGLVRSHAPMLRARGARSAAVVVVDAASGEILAEVGSIDWADRSAAGAVDLARAKHQAGSTLKPFLYARAFEKGVSPMEVLADVPTDLGTTGAVYSPDNFDGTFAGPVSAREALAGSLNVPAVRLAKDLGVKETVAVLRRSGIPIDGGAERHGLAVALGSAEVSLRDLATGYTTLARAGERVALSDRLGTKGATEHALGATAAALVADALADPLARVRGLHARGPFEFAYPVAVKTGTSTGFRDGWTAGFTKERVVVVWAGNADGSTTDRLTGAMGAGPIFFDVMKRAMRDVPNRAALVDRDLVEPSEVCALSGERPSELCPDRVQRVFGKGRAPAKTCTLHRHEGERTIVALPEAFARFLDERPVGAPGLDPHGMPWLLASKTNAEAEVEPRVVLVKPRSGSVLHADEKVPNADVVEVVATIEGLPNATPLEVLIDGEVKAPLAQPYKALVPIGRGDHAIEVRPKDHRLAAHVARADVSVR